MKHIIYILILALSFNSCNAQKKINMNSNINIPQVTKDFEKFDIKYYNENKINSEVRKLEDNTLEIQLDYSEGYSKVVYYDDSYFYVVRNFYKNGNIEIKGVRFNNGSEYGVWYEYNEDGELLKEVDMDEEYDFGWDKIIQYCEDNEIVLEKGYPKKGGIKTEIYKNEEDGKKVWTISYFDYLKKQYIGVTLDGKTGKLIKEQELEFEGN